MSFTCGVQGLNYIQEHLKVIEHQLKLVFLKEQTYLTSTLGEISLQ